MGQPHQHSLAALSRSTSPIFEQLRSQKRGSLIADPFRQLGWLGGSAAEHGFAIFRSLTSARGHDALRAVRSSWREAAYAFRRSSENEQ